MAANKHGQILRRVANPTPAIMSLINPAKGRKTMKAKRKAVTRRTRSTVAHHTARAANPRRTRKAATSKRNPILSFSKPKRRTKKNPLIVYRTKRNSATHSISGSEVIDFVIAGLGIAVAQPTVNSVVNKFVPSQYSQTASTLLTGLGGGWLLERFTSTRRFAKPIKLIAVSTAIISFALPWVRRFTTPAAPVAPNAGLSGRYSGMAGIGAVPSNPAALPAPRPVQSAAPVKPAGMRGIGVYSQPGRFVRV